MQLDFFSRTNSYHNSLPITDENVLEQKEAKAKSKDKQILEYLEAHPNQSFTPPELHLLLGQQGPLSSVRRSLTNLTKAGKLIMTDEMRPGLWGDPNHCWRLK